MVLRALIHDMNSTWPHTIYQESTDSSSQIHPTSPSQASTSQIEGTASAKVMATITASTTTSFLTAAILKSRGATSASSVPILGLPAIRRGRMKCSAEKSTAGGAIGKGASVLAAASAAVMSSPALALVDERLTTEGTGLSLGLSNNLLGWILLGVFGLIWALFFVYTSTLEEDEESGLSL